VKGVVNPIKDLKICYRQNVKTRQNDGTAAKNSGESTYARAPYDS